MAKTQKAKILFYDIEILPRHFYTNMGADRSTICSFGYKWLGDKKASSIDLLDFPKDFEKNPFLEKKLVKAAHKIMSEADVVIHHYGDKFDFPYMNTKFMQYGLPVLAQTALRDTWRTARFRMKLANNKLKTVAEFFGLESKMDIPVHTWFDVIRGDKKALKFMSKYCRQDVEVLYNVYNKVLQITPPKENVALMNGGDRLDCPNCGSKNVQKRGFRVMKTGRYQCYTCQNCGTSYRDTRMIKAK